MGARHNAVIRMDLAGTSLTAVVTRQLEVEFSANSYTVHCIHARCMGANGADVLFVSQAQPLHTLRRRKTPFDALLCTTSSALS